MFVACQNRMCPDYNKTKETGDLTGDELAHLMCGVCGLPEFAPADGPAAPEPPPPPIPLPGPDLDTPPDTAPTYVEVEHNGQRYALALTPIQEQP